MMARVAIGAASAALLAATACGGGDSAPAGSPTTTPLTSERFEVPVSVRPATGYELFADYTYAFMLRRRLDGGSTAYLLVQSLTGVYEGLSPIATAVPTDLVGWLRNNPALEFLADPEAFTIGGLSGMRIDIIGRAPQPTLLLASVGQGDEVVRLAIASGERARLIVVDVDGKTVVISGGSADTNAYFSELPAIQQMIESIQFQGSTQ